MEPKFNIGDRVRVIRKIPGHWNSFGKMDHWLGQVMTIRECTGYNAGIPEYRMEEDIDEWYGGWTWREDCLEPAEENAFDETELLTILEAM